MRLAVTGKGGAGKSALTALIALVLADEGRRVLVADLDTNPGVAVSLGIEPRDVTLPSEAVQERAGSPYGWGLADGIEASGAADRFAVAVSDRISFLGLGNIAEVDKSVKRSVTAVRTMLDAFDEGDTVVVADLEAGPTTPFEGYARFAPLWILVSEATPASLLAARRIATIAEHDGARVLAVANKVRHADDAARVEAELGPLFGSVPFDAEVRRREDVGALIGISPAGPAWQAVKHLVGAIGAIGHEGGRS